MTNSEQNIISTSEDELIAFFKSEFEKDLENKGVDTVCFMGYGYDIEDVKVGAEFYFSYSYYGRMATVKHGTKEECLRAVLIHSKQECDNYFDRYKIIQKYKYFDCHFLDSVNRKAVPFRERREYVRIKNLRTNEVTLMSELTISYSHRFCWVSW